MLHYPLSLTYHVILNHNTEFFISLDEIEESNLDFLNPSSSIFYSRRFMLSVENVHFFSSDIEMLYVLIKFLKGTALREKVSS